MTPSSTSEAPRAGAAGHALRRRWLAAGLLAWAVLGAVLAVLGLGEVTTGARPLVIALTGVGVGAAVAAALATVRGRPVAAAALAVLSVVTPTWYWYPVLVVPLCLAVVLVVDRRSLTGGDR